MANTFLINAPKNQNIRTKEAYDGWPIVYAHPDYHRDRTILGSDFLLIQVDDELIICSDSSLKYIAQVLKIEMLTDDSESEFHGQQVKVVFGKRMSTFPQISISVIYDRLSRKEISPPRLINPKNKGFKQGAFTEMLNNEQANEIKKWVTQSARSS